MVELSPTTQKLIAHMFAEDEREEVERWLETECADNLPLVGEPDPESLERIRFAVLRASNGELDRIPDLITLAQKDWRDLLVTAGFATSTKEHQLWAERILGGH